MNIQQRQTVKRASRNGLITLACITLAWHLTRLWLYPANLSQAPSWLTNNGPRLKILDDVPKRGSPDLYPDPTNNLTIAQNGAVASDVGLCSDMGVHILKQGGSAVDAAVTTALCIGSINSFSSGIGGGGFMTIRDGNSHPLAINFREMAPGAAHKNMYKENPLSSRVGGLAVAIPGEVAGLQEAHTRYGKLSWKKVIQPVIDLNRYGFEVEETLAFAVKLDEESILSQPLEWGQYIRKDGTVVKPGDWITRENLANTLELIAEHGAQVFYDPDGPVAPHLAETVQKHGGILTADDFGHYNAVVSDALIGEFLGREVITTPNPTSGPALLLGLNILEALDGDQDFGDWETHQLIETMKWMSSARSELGDSISSDDDRTAIDKMVSKSFAEDLRHNITNKTHPWQFYNPKYEPNEPHGTSHFSVIDKDGMAVSMTTTVNLLFGSKVADAKTGIVLNSEMDDFSQPNTSNWFQLAPSVYNYIKPYYRPLSSTVPTIIINKDSGAPELLIGAAGGSHIYTAVLQAIVRVLKYKQPMLQTIAYPRFHHQLLPDQVELEPVTPCFVHSQLKNRDHKVETQEPRTTMNGIHILVNGTIHAVSDWWRKRAVASGY